MENGSRQQVQRATPQTESCPNVPVTLKTLLKVDELHSNPSQSYSVRAHVVVRLTEVHICSKISLSTLWRMFLQDVAQKQNQKYP